MILQTDGNYNIWQVRDGIPTQVTVDSLQARHNPELSPDGSMVAYEQRSSGFTDVRVCNIDGSNEVVLDADVTTFMQWPSWKPDGSKIVYTISEVGSNAGGRVYEITPAGTGKTLLHDPAAGYCARRPRYSYDGSKIAFIKTWDGQTGGSLPDRQLWVMNADGTSAASIKTLTTNAATQCQFSWANTQNVLAYALAGTLTGIRKINADGTGDTLLSIDTDGNNAHAISDKAWSPTDDRVFFGVLEVVGIGTGWVVFEALADGTNENLLYEGHLLNSAGHQRTPVQFGSRLYIFPISDDRLSSINLTGGDYRVEHEIDAAPYNVGTTFGQDEAFDWL